MERTKEARGKLNLDTASMCQSHMHRATIKSKIKRSRENNLGSPRKFARCLSTMVKKVSPRKMEALKKVGINVGKKDSRHNKDIIRKLIKCYFI